MMMMMMMMICGGVLAVVSLCGLDYKGTNQSQTDVNDRFLTRCNLARTLRGMDPSKLPRDKFMVRAMVIPPDQDGWDLEKVSPVSVMVVRVTEPLEGHGGG
jgi:hypothetical protein